MLPSAEENAWHYCVVKRLSFGFRGSSFRFGRIAVLVVWVLSVPGLGRELCVDELLFIGTIKQITCDQRAATILSKMFGSGATPPGSGARAWIRCSRKGMLCARACCTTSTGVRRCAVRRERGQDSPTEPTGRSDACKVAVGGRV